MYVRYVCVHSYWNIFFFVMQVNLSIHNFMVIPINYDLHWCLIIVDFSQHQFTYYDSMLRNGFTHEIFGMPNL